MKTINYLLTVIGVSIILTSILSSCGTTDKVVSESFIQKRKYNKGWYVNLLAKTPKTKSIKNEIEFFTETLEYPDRIYQEHITDNINTNREKEWDLDNITVSVDNSVIPIHKKTPVIFPESRKKMHQKPQVFAGAEDCDILTLKNGDDIEVKVIEIGTSEIKYKRCDNLDGPTISVRKSEVFSIKYPNGTKDIISSSNSSTIENANLTNREGDKSLVLTLILWFFLGLIGIHRFYLGHIGMGVLYFLTGALCGIGWFIDIILLLTGGLKPKNGEFYDNL